MVQGAQTTGKQRIVYAPAPSSLDGSSAVISVTLGEDEEVQWQWSHFPDGQSFVTGYEVIKKPAQPDPDSDEQRHART